MARTYVFYNPLAGSGACKNDAAVLEAAIPGECVLCDMTKPETYASVLFALEPEDQLILCGGDGTLNRFINLTSGMDFPNEIYYCPMGSGNDFALDLGHRRGDAPFPIGAFLKSIPTVTVKNREYRFLNGIGFGIDGYCCQEGDRIRPTKKKVNYTAIAVKGLLFHYRPRQATVTVDGVTHRYNRVWLAPTMLGRFYGGGMMPTPGQSRAQPEQLSVMIFHNSGKLRTLTIFPSIFSGNHVKYKKQVEILSGKTITVEFNRPTPLQIDGETILDVTSYTAACALCPAAEGLEK